MAPSAYGVLDVAGIGAAGHADAARGEELRRVGFHRRNSSGALRRVRRHRLRCRRKRRQDKERETPVTTHVPMTQNDLEFYSRDFERRRHRQSYYVVVALAEGTERDQP